MAYIPHTAHQRQAQLASLGMESMESLLGRQVPPDLRLRRPLDIPPGMSEIELRRHFRELSGLSRPAEESICFLGAGIYDHSVPSVVGNLAFRGEFHTAYTPYQPEMSQGTLQTIFEFQSMICALTGMDAANASMYDGATALAEAVILGCGATNRDEALLLNVHPAWASVVRTYVEGLGIWVIESDRDSGLVDRDWLSEVLGAGTAVVAIQQPGFLGCVERIGDLAERAHQAGALLAVAANPIALGVLEAPGRLGADVVVGEGQPLGLGMNFGGPLLGYFAARKQFLRQMPGRLVSETQDKEGRRGYVLTLQTREQHIRRERATSNICTNQGLMMTAATVYLAAVGPQGLCEIARQCLSRAHYAAGRLTAIPGFSTVFPRAPFFHEFALKCPLDAGELCRRLERKGIQAGLPLGRFGWGPPDRLLVAVTEKRTLAEIDRFAEAAAEACGAP